MSKKIWFPFITFLMFATVSLAANSKYTLVIDAGHGGRDSGAMGAVSKEKDLTLRYALAFGSIVERNCKDVKVVYTRKSDVYLTLNERAVIANRHKADLFVSVHINSIGGGRIARGYQTYTLGRSLRNGNTKGIQQNLEVSKRENAVIYMEKDGQTLKALNENSAETDIMAELVQDNNREMSVELAKYLQTSICASTGRANGGVFQDNLAVLRLSSMPGCLMELGFISTPDEEEYLNSEAATQAYAQGFLQAFLRYKNKTTGGISVPYKSADDDTNLPNIVPDTYREGAQKADSSAAARPVQVEAPQQAEPKKAAVAKAEPAKKPEKKEAPRRQKATAAPDAPVFKLQICVGSNKLKAGDSGLKGITQFECVEENGKYKYTTGSSTDYNEINRLRKQLAEKFPGAFIVAFKKGKPVDVNQAISEFLKNKKK